MPLTPEERRERNRTKCKAAYQARGPRTEADRAAARAYYMANRHKRQSPEAKAAQAAAARRHAPKKAIRDSARRISIRDVVAKLKEAVPCSDCGQHFPYYVMDFDHRHGKAKTQVVSALVAQGCALKTVMAEIAKCDIVCANCHRKRTHQDRQT